MEFKFENFGKAGNGTIDINDLTIICGPNNSGKTYINYAIYSILSRMEELIEFKLTDSELKKIVSELKNGKTVRLNINKKIDQVGKYFSKSIPIIGSEISEHFNVPKKNFKKSKISMSIDDFGTNENSPISLDMSIDDILFRFIHEGDNKWLMFEIENKLSKKEKNSESILKMFETNFRIAADRLNFHIDFLFYFSYLEQHFFYPVAITSERTGISLFYKIFDEKNEKILSQLGKSHKSIAASTVNSLRSLHALPIQDNINLVRSFEKISKKASKFTNSEKLAKGNKRDVIDILNELLDNGSFVSRNDTLMYQPRKTNNGSEPTLEFHSTSSSIKSLFLFDVFVRYIASERNILIIDEPELNLHPENQVKMARLVARIVNCGITVVVTTHSDFFIREISNLITLNSVPSKYKQKLKKKYGVRDSDILDVSKVSAFESTPHGKINRINVSKSGIDSKLLDSIIGVENQKSEEFFIASGLINEE